MKRRDFVTLLSGAVAWPFTARAQQPAMSVVGMLNPQSPGSIPHLVGAFRRGLAETSYVEGQNVVIESRWAEDRYDRIPELAADLVARKVSVIATPSNAAALAAKAATSTIPVVFGVGEDPVRLGLVASLARPGGNATGINFFAGEVVAKRLGVLHELVPAASRIALLVNPANLSATSSTLAAMERAAPALGMQIQVYNASSIREIDVRSARARAGRCRVRRPRPVLPDQARAVGLAGRAPCASRHLFAA
jgi:putative ABC transport system substrate-binding protein